MSGNAKWKQVAQAAYKLLMREEYPYDRFVMEERVQARVEELQQKRLRQKLIWAGAALCVCVVLVWMFWRTEPPLQRQETTIQPPLHSFQYHQPDEGYMQALAQGYPVLSSPKVTKDGFTFEVKEAIVDAQRLTYALLISGEKIEALASIAYGFEKEEALYRSIGTKPEATGSQMTSNPRGDLIERDGRHYYVMEAETVFFDPTIMEKQAFLPYQELSIVVAYSENREHKVLLPLKLPETVTSARLIQDASPQKKEFKLGQSAGAGKLKITNWVMSPTVVRVDLTGVFPDGQVLKSLENIQLADDTGKTYHSLGAQQLGDTNVFYFTPSPYFTLGEEKNSAVKPYHLRFTGYKTGIEQENTYTLSRNAVYPKHYTMDDQTRVEIREVAWTQQEEGKLQITMAKVPDDGQFYVTIDGVDASERMDDDQTTTFSFPVPQKAQYQMKCKHTTIQEHTYNGDLPFTMEGKKE